jgi:hypothetical protein
LGGNGNGSWRLAVLSGTKCVDCLTVAVLSILELETRVIDTNSKVWPEALSQHSSQLLTSPDRIHNPQHSLTCSHGCDRGRERIVLRR